MIDPMSSFVRWFRERLLPSAVTYIGMLPIAAFVFFATDGHPSSGVQMIGAVLFVDLILCVIIGIAAMAGSYVAFLVNHSSPWPNRMMKYGCELVCYAFLVIFVLAALNEAGVIKVD